MNNNTKRIPHWRLIAEQKHNPNLGIGCLGNVVGTVNGFLKFEHANNVWLVNPGDLVQLSRAEIETYSK